MATAGGGSVPRELARRAAGKRAVNRLPLPGVLSIASADVQARIAVMSYETLDQHIELTPDAAGGKPRLRGRRITVQDIAIWHERLGKSADEISAEYDVTLADVYAALAYYFDHREEIDQRIAEDKALVEALRNVLALDATNQFALTNLTTALQKISPSQ